MTKDELEIIKEFLDRVPGCLTEEQRRVCDTCAKLAFAKKIIDRELKLKSMDPRK